MPISASPRALAEASWTEPAGAVVGTARYAAPEQATGAPLDGRADLYSLAVVLVEAVTGTVPAVADTAIGTLAARTHTPIVAPPELRRLGPVVERAGRPDPADRYPDAATMRAALTDVARVLPPPQPLPLVGLSGEIDSDDLTQIGGSSKLFDQDAPSVETEIEIIPDPPSPRRRRPGSTRWVSAVVVGAILLALVGGGVALLTTGGGTTAVPSLVGLSTKAATDKAAAVGLSLTITQRQADDPKDVVIGQHPAPGSFTGAGGSVELVVSRGPPPVVVPNVAGRSAADATAALQDAGFAVNPKLQYDPTIPAGNVIGTDPKIGAGAPRDSSITLIVSQGPQPVPVPDVSNQTFDQASQALTAAGFAVTRRDDFERDGARRQSDRDRPARRAGDRAGRAGHDQREQGARDGHGAQPRPDGPRRRDRGVAERRLRRRHAELSARSARARAGPRGRYVGGEGHEGHAVLLSRDVGRASAGLSSGRDGPLVSRRFP